MKTVTFLAGAGGSGKSTVLKQQAHLQGQEVVNSDHFIEANPLFVAGLKTAAALQAWAKPLAKAQWQACLAKGVSFIKDGTFSKASTQEDIQEALEAGFSVQVLWVKVPLELCLLRAKKREAARVAKGLAPRVVPTWAIREACAGAVTWVNKAKAQGIPVQVINNYTWEQALDGAKEMMMSEVVWA